MERRTSRQLQLGRVAIGGGWPISVQSMTTTAQACSGTSIRADAVTRLARPVGALGAREGLLSVCGRRSETTSRREHAIYLRFSWWALWN